MKKTKQNVVTDLSRFAVVRNKTGFEPLPVKERRSTITDAD